MKTKAMVFLLLLLLIFTGCSKADKQGEPLERKPQKKELAQGDTLRKPDVRVKVNKQYDDKGNLIRYDSAYSYRYVGPGMQFADSILERFRSRMNFSFPGMSPPPFDNIYLDDSFFRGFPFDGNPLLKDPGMYNRQWEQMHRRLDSIRRSMLRPAETNNYKTG